MKLSIFGAAALCACIGTSVLAQSAARTVPVDKDFQSADIRWTGSIGGGYAGLIAIKNNGGYLELCGVGIVTNIRLSNSVETALKGGKMTVNGKVVLKNFSYFAKARSKRALAKTQAHCRTSGTKVPREIKSLNVEYGNATFRN